MERGQDGETKGLGQSVLNQNEIKARLSGLPEPCIEAPTGLDPIATTTQVGGQGFPELHVWIDDLHAWRRGSAHLVHANIVPYWAKRIT
jgi:hypothetical protein